MASVQSVLSTPKQGSQTQQPISKILFKAISKSKCTSSKMRELNLEYSNLAQSKLKHKNEKGYQIVQIRKGNTITRQTGQSILPLGQLHVDQLTNIYSILERRIEKDCIELRLSPSNFLCENTGPTKMRNLSPQNHILQFYNYLPQQTFPLMDKKKFEDNLSLPFECVNLTYQNEQLLGISKKMNYDFIRLMGINLEIIDDYISNHSQLPECWNLNSLIMINENRQQYIVQMINYQGEEIQAQVEFKKFLYQCKNNLINEYYIYIIVHCDRKQLNVTKIEQNYLHYFDQKQLTSKQFISIHKSRILKECLIKPLKTRFDL